MECKQTGSNDTNKTGCKQNQIQEHSKYFSPVWKIQKMVKNPCLSVKNMRIYMM